MDERDKTELMFCLIQKIFCIGQQAYAMSQIH